MSRAKVQYSEDELEILLERVKKWINSDKDADVARALEVSSSSIPTWRKRGTVPYGELVQWAYRNEVSLDWLFCGGDGNMYDGVAEPSGSYCVAPEQGVTPKELASFVQVPQYDVETGAGSGKAIHSEQIVDHLAFKETWVRRELGINPKRLVLISAIGDSMEPTLSDGDLILVSKSEDRLLDDAIYVLHFDGTLLVKRVQRLLDGSVVIKSDNAAYQPQTVQKAEVNQLSILGRVVWVCKRM